MLPFIANAVNTFKWLPPETPDQFAIEPALPLDLSWDKLLMDMQQFCCGLAAMSYLLQMKTLINRQKSILQVILPK